MSQTVPLSQLLSDYNTSVETFHHRMQEDNMNHIDNMISTYAHALEGGATPATLNYLEKAIANRDNLNNYRMAKDATEWMMVDKKLHSYLGRDMNILTGGNEIHAIPAEKESQMVQCARVQSAYMDNLAKKMMQARGASLRELKQAVERVMSDPAVSDEVKGMLESIVIMAKAVDQSKLERDAQDMFLLEYMTMNNLSPSTAACITKCGTKVEAAASGPLLISSSKHLPPPDPSESLEGGCGSSWAAGMSMRGGQKKVHQDQEWLAQVSHDWMSGGEHKSPKSNAPKFRSPAAAQLYNLISSQ